MEPVLIIGESISTQEHQDIVKRGIKMLKDHFQRMEYGSNREIHSNEKIKEEKNKLWEKQNTDTKQ